MLNYAISRKLIDVNPNSSITLHKIEKYNAATLNADQMQQYLEFIVGDFIENPILLGGFYGMRRSECIATRESQFDFRHGFFRANHTILSNLCHKTSVVRKEVGKYFFCHQGFSLPKVTAQRHFT